MGPKSWEIHLIVTFIVLSQPEVQSLQSRHSARLHTTWKFCYILWRATFGLKSFNATERAEPASHKGCRPTCNIAWKSSKHFNQSEELLWFGKWHLINMEFLHLLLRCHLAGKTVACVAGVVRGGEGRGKRERGLGREKRDLSSHSLLQPFLSFFAPAMQARKPRVAT